MFFWDSPVSDDLNRCMVLREWHSQELATSGVSRPIRWRH